MEVYYSIWFQELVFIKLCRKWRSNKSAKTKSQIRISSFAVSMVFNHFLKLNKGVFSLSTVSQGHSYKFIISRTCNGAQYNNSLRRLCNSLFYKQLVFFKNGLRLAPDIKHLAPSVYFKLEIVKLGKYYNLL